MAEEIKRTKVEDDDAFVADAKNTLAWLWATGYPAPGDLTFSTLLRVSKHLWETDKICILDHVEGLFSEYKASMSVDELAKYEASHPLAQEFAFLHFKTRFMNAVDFKLMNMTMEEFIKWEEDAEKED